MKVRQSREEILRIAAEKVRQKKEKEKREEDEFYARITTGQPWLFFKAIVALCTLVVMLTTIEFFFDGRTEKLTEKDWKIDRNWEWPWHQILDVKGYLFAPELGDWLDHVDNSLEITYSPIFGIGKKLSYDIQVNESITRRHEESRFRSIFGWFPWVQLLLLIPLVTLIFKRQRPWFMFARLASMFFVLPMSFLVIYLSLP